jgi:hypothetical protein
MTTTLTYSEFTPVREALAELIGSLLDDADVGRIDLGSDPVAGGPLLRIHLRNFTALHRLSFPEEVDGVAVRLVVESYPLRG